ncbi:MAG: hypothetical protein AVDCRST_MAG26-4636, partial [uncultured Chloroflexia bacterium]
WRSLVVYLHLLVLPCMPVLPGQPVRCRFQSQWRHHACARGAGDSRPG